MADPSGNEDIAREHGLAGLVFWAWFVLALVALLWINLAHAAASYRPGWGGQGALGTIVTALLRPKDVWAWFHAIIWQGLFGGQALVWPFWYFVGRMLHQTPSPALWTWIYQASYALNHSIGAPPLYMGVVWNLALVFVAVWAPPLLVTRRMASGRGMDARLGTAHWPAPKVLTPYTRAAGSPGALPLGRIVRNRPGAGSPLALPLRDPQVNVGRFSHAAIWGVSEAGKTSGVFKPWLWSDLFMNDPSRMDPDGWPASAMSSVVIDMKHPDIYTDLAPYAAVLPRRLLLLAPGDPARSLHYNPLDFVRAAQGPGSGAGDIEALADAIILNTPRGEKDDQYHQGRERSLLELLIRYVCDVQEAADRGVRDAAGVYDELVQMIRPVLPDGSAIPSLKSFPMIAALARLSGARLIEVMQGTITDPAHPENWRVRCEQFAPKAVRSEDLTGWLGGLQRRLSAFTTPGVVSISNRSDFSLDLVGRQPGTLIVGMPRELTKGLEPYSALIITQLLQQLKRVAAASPTRRLPVPVTLYLDELPAQGRIPQLEHEIATLRDMAVSFVCGMQSSAALEAKYGRDIAEAIKSNTNTKIVIGRRLGLEDAKYFSQLAGETTILTSGSSEGSRGGGRSTHTARRALITPDQIIRMPQFEALVFLQTGHHTQTRLRPFHKAQRERAGLARDHRFVTGGRTRDGAIIEPVVYLRDLQAKLDRVLGPWDTRPPRPGPAPLPATAGGSTIAATPASEGGSVVRQAEPIAERAEARDHGPGGVTVEERPDPAITGGDSRPARDDVTSLAGDTPPAPGAGNGAGDTAQPGAPDPAQPAGSPHDPGAVSDLAGLFNTLVRGRLWNGQLGHGATPGWWVRLPGGDHLLVRWSFVRSFGELRRTKARDIAGRWQRAGFVVPRRLSVAERGENVPVLAFTPDAVRRLTPAVTDVIGAWPRRAPGELRGLELEPAAAGMAISQGGSARTAKNDPGEALRVVADWARANRAALQSTTAQESGQWEAVVQGEPVLLVRQPYLNRILMGRKFDLRVIMAVWRETRVIVAEEKRFTIHTRVPEQGQQGARFVAFRWDKLEAAGLART
jgi:hypothetical protein